MLNLVLVEPEIPANTGNIGRTCVVTGTRLHLVKPLGFSLDEKALRRAGLGYWENLDLAVYDSWDEFLHKNKLDGTNPLRMHLLTKKARHTYAESTYRNGDFLVLGKESSGLPEELLATYPTCCERIPMLPDEASLANRETWARTADALQAAKQRGGSFGVGNASGSGTENGGAGVGGACPDADASAEEGADAGAGHDAEDARAVTAQAAAHAAPAQAASAQAAPSHTAPAHAPLLRQDICGNFINPDDYRISALNLSNAAAIVLYEALRQIGFPGM